MLCCNCVARHPGVSQVLGLTEAEYLWKFWPGVVPSGERVTHHGHKWSPYMVQTTGGHAVSIGQSRGTA